MTETEFSLADHGGNPAWAARLDAAKADSSVKWTWSGRSNRRVLEALCMKDFRQDKPPILLPSRMKSVKVMASAGLKTFLSDEFPLSVRSDLATGKTHCVQITPAERENSLCHDPIIS